MSQTQAIIKSRNNMNSIKLKIFIFSQEWYGRDVRVLGAYAFSVTCITLNTFLICYIGEVLSEKCKKISNMIYMTNWYRLSEKDILNLIMIMIRSGMEYKMTAGKIINMSVVTFGNVRLLFNFFKKYIASIRMYLYKYILNFR